VGGKPGAKVDFLLLPGTPEAQCLCTTKPKLDCFSKLLCGKQRMTVRRKKWKELGITQMPNNWGSLKRSVQWRLASPGEAF
jgi:hypothetical protein